MTECLSPTHLGVHLIVLRFYFKNLLELIVF